MPSGAEPESKDSELAFSGNPVIEHPADVCECGHLRGSHGPLGVFPDVVSACLVKGESRSGYADICEEFALAKTALAVACETARVCTGVNNAHRPYAVGVTDDGTCPLCADLEKNQRRTFMVPQENCDDCGHYVDLHEDDGCTSRSGCDCMVGARVPDPQEQAFQEMVELTEELGLYDEQAPVVVPVLYSPAPLRPYRVTYVVSGGQAYEMDVPGDASVTAEDGMIKIVHGQRAVLAIQSITMFPTLEPRGDE